MNRLEHTLDYIETACRDEFKFYNRIWLQYSQHGKGKMVLMFTFFTKNGYRIHSIEFNNFVQMKEIDGNFTETPAFVAQLKYIIEYLTDAHYTTTFLQKMEMKTSAEFGAKYSDTLRVLFPTYSGYAMHVGITSQGMKCDSNSVVIYHEQAQFDKTGKPILDKEGNHKINEIPTSYTYDQLMNVLEDSAILNR